jgi:phosphoglycolate phosphatase
MVPLLSKNKDFTLICDLDNTLYDWVGYFVPSLYQMVDQAILLLSCDREMLLDQLREVHQKYHNSEHPYAILETNLVQQWLKSGHDLTELEPIFRAFNLERKKRLVPYEGVVPTMHRLRHQGIRLVAHSDSNVFGVIDRISRLQLQDFFDEIYCVEGSGEKHPTGGPYSSRYKDFPWSKIHLLAHEDRKPNPALLSHILRASSIDIDRVAFIGDSIAKDIHMAQEAGIYSIWARYGTGFDPALYQQLVRISHWTRDDVQRENEARLAAANTLPDFICAVGFHEVPEAFNHLQRRANASR